MAMVSSAYFSTSGLQEGRGEAYPIRDCSGQVTCYMLLLGFTMNGIVSRGVKFVVALKSQMLYLYNSVTYFKVCHEWLQ